VSARLRGDRASASGLGRRGRGARGWKGTRRCRPDKCA